MSSPSREPTTPEDERLADWVDGRLSAEEQARFEAELEGDETLRRRAESYRATVELIRRSASDERAPLDMADAVMERVGTSPRWWSAWPGLAAAAAVLVAGVLWWQMGSGTPTVRDTAVLDQEQSAAPSLARQDRVAPEEELVGVSMVEVPAEKDALMPVAEAPAAPRGEASSQEPAEMTLALGDAEGEEKRAKKQEFAPPPRSRALMDDVAPSRQAGEEQEALLEQAADTGLEASREDLLRRARTPAQPAADEDGLMGESSDWRENAMEAALGRLVLVVSVPAAAEPEPAGEAGGKGKVPATRSLASPVPTWLAPSPLEKEGAVLQWRELPASVLQQPNSLELREGDRLFSVRGAEEQVLAYVTSVRAGVARRGGEVDIRRTAPGEALGLDARQAESAEQAGRRAWRKAAKGEMAVWIVLRATNR